MVTVGLIGTPTSGKNSLARFLAKHHHFQLILVQNAGFDPDPSLASTQINAHSPKDQPSFPSFAAVCAHVTANWQQNFVLTISAARPDFFTSPLIKRPFFVLIHVQRPRLWEPMPALFYQNHKIVSLTVFNDGSLCQLERAAADRLSPAHLQCLARPPWDTYFLSLAKLAALRSNCMKRRMGAVVVRDHRVLSTGYNGTPQTLPNCGEGGCPRCNGGVRCGKELDLCLCLHAEENALMEVGGRRAMEGSTLYCTTQPCLGCAKKIVQAGIRRVIWSEEYSMDHDSVSLFKQAHIEYVRVTEDSRFLCCSLFAERIS